MNFTYMSKLFVFSKEVEGLEMIIKDLNLQKNFINLKSQIDNKKAKVFCLFCFPSYILGMSFNFYTSQVKLFLLTF